MMAAQRAAVMSSASASKVAALTIAFLSAALIRLMRALADLESFTWATSRTTRDTGDEIQTNGGQPHLVEDGLLILGVGLRTSTDREAAVVENINAVSAREKLVFITNESMARDGLTCQGAANSSAAENVGQFHISAGGLTAEDGVNARCGQDGISAIATTVSVGRAEILDGVARLERERNQRRLRCPLNTCLSHRQNTHDSTTAVDVRVLNESSSSGDGA
jgi:hypothetical protein